MERVLELQVLDGGLDPQSISTASPIFCASGASIIFCMRPAGQADDGVDA